MLTYEGLVRLDDRLDEREESVVWERTSRASVGLGEVRAEECGDISLAVAFHVSD